MQEYWVNVYKNGNKVKYNNRYNAVVWCAPGVAYRIHVKMKDKKPRYEDQLKLRTNNNGFDS